MRRMVVICSLCCCCMQLLGQPARQVLDQFQVQVFASNTPAVKKNTIPSGVDISIFNYQEYTYTLTPRPDKKYKEYQVIPLDGLDNTAILIGMITHTLDRETRYIELEGVEATAAIREALEGKADYIFVNPAEKQYFMLPDGSFRYIDGRELVGDKKLVAYLEKGKPITAATFYFALKERGLIRPDMSLRTFLSMSLDEKLKLLDMDIYASSKVSSEQE
ncbi:MAG: hypothetical protein KatS3mg031_0969 [Chitinophagales bacterium]|nr:MAG: hypothetical protein KatS3mg031_0969 [Chitinophagales bacterium]